MKPGGPDRAGGMQSLKHDRGQKAMHERLMEQVVDPENARRAMQAVVANGGAPGIDGMTTGQLESHLERHWDSLSARLLAGRFTPSPVRRAAAVGTPGRQPSRRAVIYLDSSAIVKLLREEDESAALHAYLMDGAPPLFSSQLAITEVKRALHAAGDQDAASAVATSEPPALVVPGHRILALPLSVDVVIAAGDLLPAVRLRRLDALQGELEKPPGRGLLGLFRGAPRVRAGRGRARGDRRRPEPA